VSVILRLSVLGLLLAVAGAASQAEAARSGSMPGGSPMPRTREIGGMGARLIQPLPNAQYAIATRPGQIGMIVAPVMLNGQGPFRFMLDTGATRSVVAASTLAKLNLKPDENAKISVVGVSGTTVVATVHIDTVDSGAMHFRDLQAPVLSGEFMKGLDGILGMDGLNGMTLSADFAQDRVVIGNAATQSLSKYALTGRFVSQRLLMVEGTINGVRTQAVIDTGAAHTLGNPALLAILAHGGAQPVKLKSNVIDVTDASQAGTAQRIAEMRMGAQSIRNLTVTFGDYQVFKTWGLEGQPALLLGMDVLGTLADFTVDYRHAQLQVLAWPGPNS
jgi:predicted aspartyl protease